MGKPRQKKEGGQIAIMVVLMIMTFLGLFKFSVDIGLLVNAKINLQNAADMAAYAGAATQARQLNHISFLNYEMRRQFKKFLFRYYVLGNMAQKTMPTVGSQADPAGGQRTWAPETGPGKSYQVPATCFIFDADDNYCQNRTLRSIAVEDIRTNPLDNINTTLKEQAKVLEGIRQQGCKGIERVNRLVTFLWLFNMDPNLERMEQNLTGAANLAEVLKDFNKIKGLAYGLGLIPREIFLKMRIDTLASYVNTAPQNVTPSNIGNFEQAGDVAAYERTIQAFRSAYYTLGDYLFDGDSVQMQELLPLGAEAADLLRLKELRTSFETYYVGFPTIATNVNSSAIQRGQDCIGEPMRIDVEDLPVGVVKSPQLLTYYAVQLKAKAKTLFWPGFSKAITLKAYSAAQPFGSRIGPDLEADATGIFINEGLEPSAQNINPCQAKPCRGVPNLRVQATDTLQQGWNSVDLITGLFSRFVNAGGSGGNDLVITPDIIEDAVQFALAPNPWEKGKYNILNDLGAPRSREAGGGEEYQRFFSDDQRDRREYSFWAPLVSGVGTTISEAITQKLEEAETSGLQGIGSVTGELKALVNDYVNDLEQGAGENGEGVKVVRLADPFSSRPGTSGQSQSIVGTLDGMGQDFFMTERNDIKTSWPGMRDAISMGMGRTGYSVKFVSFQTLLSPQGVSSDGENVWSNAFSTSDDTEDVEYLKH